MAGEMDRLKEVSKTKIFENISVIFVQKVGPYM
jgi:hypothetical protein